MKICVWICIVRSCVDRFVRADKQFCEADKEITNTLVAAGLSSNDALTLLDLLKSEDRGRENTSRDSDVCKY